MEDKTPRIKSNSEEEDNSKTTKECVAVLTMLYKKNGAVSHVASDFLSDWALYTANTRPIVV